MVAIAAAPGYAPRVIGLSVNATWYSNRLTFGIARTADLSRSVISFATISPYTGRPSARVSIAHPIYRVIWPIALSGDAARFSSKT